MSTGGKARGKLAEDGGKGKGGRSLVPALLYPVLGIGVVANYELAVLTEHMRHCLCFLPGEGKEAELIKL